MELLLDVCPKGVQTSKAISAKSKEMLVETVPFKMVVIR